MKTQSLKNSILWFLRLHAGQVFSGAELEERNYDIKGKASIKGRRLRELAKEGSIKTKYINNKVHYFVDPPEKKIIGYANVLGADGRMERREITETIWN
jgi:hypothetical protein